MKTLLTAFDIFPSAKGASAHIAQNLKAIRGFKETAALACLGTIDDPKAQMEDGLTILRCRMMHPNFLKRAEIFGDFVWSLLNRANGGLTSVHFRDIWGGIPILKHYSSKRALKIFEVNGFPSIELPCRYPALERNNALLNRIRGMEDLCLSKADRIITVSDVNADYIVSRGVAREKITVIPNTTDIDEAAPSQKPIANGKKRILYSGCLAPWQGVETLLRAYALIAHRDDVKLTMAVSNRKYLKPYLKLVHKLGMEENVEIKTALPKEELAALYASSAFSVAPLARCERNETQGACPIKIIDSMAMGVPVIASDLAIARELVENGVDGLLVTPDSPRALAVGMTALLDDPAKAETIGRNARKSFEDKFSRSSFMEKLRKVYTEN
ncbi:MAG: glycosyltransferase family 4 protein [Nitrospinae bacterium]|nr:glycosyltransferase family 4 protein [Nitrospinota bacterium]